MKKTKTPKTLKPVRANAGIAANYRRRMLCLIDEMHNSVLYWIGAAFKRNEPMIAQDALPSKELERAVKELAKQWQGKFNKTSRNLAKYFAQSVGKRSDNALRKILKDGGISIPFKPTLAMRDVMQSTVSANVALIKSIPQQYLVDVQGLVMRSVQTGQDVGALTKALEKRYHLTRKRAALIARDQNHKATSAMNNARQRELGITQARWKHSHAGKHPRPSHVKADGKLYDVDKGMYLDGVWTFPGFEINCRCTSESVIPGFIY